MRAEDLYKSPNALASHYQKFAVAERSFLTGHSHQAWPDCGFEGQKQAWLDAAAHIDDKWERAFEKADRVRRGFSRLIDDGDGHVALGSNTHELVVRLLSALPLRDRPRIVTTDEEFHTIRRQLDRLIEEDLDIVKVSSTPVTTLAERLGETVDGRTAIVMVSSVLFQSARIVPGIGRVLAACRREGAELLVDAYHRLNIVPFSLKEEHLEEAFVVGGGYKYCQLGEGNCFLRFPRTCTLRPIITGWYSEFTSVAEDKNHGGTVYGQGADRFAGATYDPTSHYRAAEVFDFFETHKLTPKFLREVSQHQVGLLMERFDALDVDSAVVTRDRSVSLEGIGGFLALHTPHAAELYRLLHERGVATDYRAETLRLGPAPYLSDDQLNRAMDSFADAVRAL